MKYVWVELVSGVAVRIFKCGKDAAGSSAERIAHILKTQATGEIRKQIWWRTKGECEWCTKIITEESMHMHEVIHRGQGGEVSIENSVGICAECHIGPLGAHSDRRPRFGERN